MTTTPDNGVMSPHDPESVLRFLYQSYKAGDLSRFVPFIDPACEWFFPGRPTVLPWAGRFCGLEIFEFARRIESSIRYEQFEDLAYHPSGETVTALLRERCRVLSTGHVFENEIAAIATVRGGKLVRYVEYSDTSAMERAFHGEAALIC